MFDILKKKKSLSPIAPSFNPKIIDLTTVKEYKRTGKDKLKARLAYFRSFDIMKMGKVVAHRLKAKKKYRRCHIKNLVKKWHYTVKKGNRLSRKYVWAGNTTRFTYTSQAKTRSPFTSSVKVAPFTADAKLRQTPDFPNMHDDKVDNSLNKLILLQQGKKKVEFLSSTQNL